MPKQKPGKGLMGWLGRQIGYVKKAVATPVDSPRVIARRRTMKETAHPRRSDLTLRRTTIDEVIAGKEAIEDLRRDV